MQTPKQAEPVTQRRTWKLISLSEAIRRMETTIPRSIVRIVRVPVLEAYGRVLAEQIRSPIDVPAFPRAAMDGYAFKAESTQKAALSNLIVFRVVGSVMTGTDSDHPAIGDGETVYVTTGSQLPVGADCVAAVETVRLVGRSVLITKPFVPSENVDEKGRDVKKGESVFTRGHAIRAQDVAMLIALGRKSVLVVKKPKVALIPVGDELVESGSRSDGGVVDTNTIVFSRLLESFHARPYKIKPQADRMDSIARAIREEVETADLVITFGGSSVSAKDLVPEAVRSLRGSEILFHGLALFPGKPVGLAMVNGRPVLILPGRVLSALAGFYLVALPVLSRLTGIELDSWLPRIRAVAKSEFKSKTTASRFEIVTVERKGNGFEAQALPKGVGLLSFFVKASGYVALPPGSCVEAGGEVDVCLFAPQELRGI